MNLNDIEQDYKKDKLTKVDYISNMYTQKHSVLFDYSDFIKNKDIQRIEITDGSVIMTTRQFGIKMICNKFDHRDIPIEIMNFGEYEKQDSNMIMKLVKDNDTVFDIGGNMGWYSIILAKFKHDLEIHTFEPIPNTYESLVTNSKLNGVKFNIYNIGLSNKEHEITFYYYKECSGNASSALMNEDKDNIQIKCKVNTIDNFVNEKDIKKIDFIKCDVEGAELLTFQGGFKTLKQHQPIVFTEMLRKWSAKFNYHPNKTLEFFQSLGYRCFFSVADNLKELTIMTDDTVETNFFFLHADKHRDLILELNNG